MKKLKFTATLSLLAIFGVSSYISLYSSVGFSQDSPDATAEKGIELLNSDNYDEALKTFDQVLSIDQNNIKSLLNKGLILYFKQKHQEALPLLDKVIELDSKNKEAWYFKGLVLFEMSKLDQSIAAFDEVLKIDPMYRLAKTSRCNALRESGNAKESDNCIKNLK